MALSSGIEIVQLMLGKEGDLQVRRNRHLAFLQRQAAADQLGKRRLTIAIRPEQRNAVIRIDAQVQMTCRMGLPGV